MSTFITEETPMVQAQSLLVDPVAPVDKRLVALSAPESPAAEQFRVLWQRLLRLAIRRPMRVVAVTSAASGEGRTTTAVNLALTAAQDGRLVLLLEADLRRPSLAKLLNMPERAGIGDLLEGKAELSQAVGRLGPLSVLCAGEVRDPASLLRSARAPAIVEQLRTAFDLVIVDAPTAMAFVDGDQLAGSADAAVLVVRAGVTPRPMVRLALEAIGDRAVGVVLNGVDPDATVHGRFIYAGGEDAPGVARRRVG